MPRLKIALVAAELVNAWLSLGKLLGWLLLPALLLSTGCTIKTGSGSSVAKRPAVVAPVPNDPPKPIEPLPTWEDPLDIRPESEISELSIRIGVRLRGRNGLRYLFSDELLTKAAQQHADWMARTGRLGHQGPGGNWPADRIRAAGYEFSAWGENVAGDFETPIDVIRAWLSSPGHKAAMLNPEFTQAGYGMAVDRNGRKCWVAVFARPK